jgi:nucleotide-binding universal stress UspA family protein
MLDTLLVPLDFSPSSKRALAYAVDLTGRTGAALHLAYVEETAENVLSEGERPPVPSYKLREQFEARAREALEPHDLSAEDDRLAFHTNRSEAVAPSLIQTAKSTDADLIVMGTHGRRGVQRAIYGSVAEEVLRAAPTPVLTTRQREQQDPPQVSDPSVERIVVPVDFSDLSRSALRYAAQFAPVYDVPMRLVHAVEEPTFPPGYGTSSPKMKVREAKERAEEELQSWGEALVGEGVRVSYVVHRGDPGDVVVQATGQAGTLTVMGTRGLSGARRTMLGSVTEAVIREARGPVLAGRSFPGADA